jgi:hypothetical protein
MGAVTWPKKAALGRCTAAASLYLLAGALAALTGMHLMHIDNKLREWQLWEHPHLSVPHVARRVQHRTSQHECA